MCAICVPRSRSVPKLASSSRRFTGLVIWCRQPKPIHAVLTNCRERVNFHTVFTKSRVKTIYTLDRLGVCEGTEFIMILVLSEDITLLTTLENALHTDAYQLIHVANY